MLPSMAGRTTHENYLSRWDSTANVCSEGLLEYALELAEIGRRETRFVIVDGSTAEGSDRKYSDYDVFVVRKGLFKEPGSVKDLFGMFN